MDWELVRPSPELVTELERELLQQLRSGEARQTLALMGDACEARKLSRAPKESDKEAIRIQLAVVEAVWRLLALGIVLPCTLAGAGGQAMLQWTPWPHLQSDQTDYRLMYPMAIRLTALGSTHAAHYESALYTPELYVHDLAGLGSRVTACLAEAVEAHRRGLALATVILVGAASEGAWWGLAADVARRLNNERLGRLADPEAGTHLHQLRSETVRLLQPYKGAVKSETGRDLAWIEARARDMAHVRDEAVHGLGPTIPIDAAVAGSQLFSAHDYFLAILRACESFG